MKKFSFIILLFINIYSLLSQEIGQAFINIPDKYIPALTKEKRSELIYRHNILNIDTISNNFKGVSKLETLDRNNQYIKVDPSEKSTFELKIWIKEDSSKVIGISHTVCGPICDSHVAFFNSNYERLDFEEITIFPNVTILDFFDMEKIKSSGEKIEDLVKKYDILFASIYFQPDNNILVTSNSKEYLPSDIYAEIEPYLLGNKVLLTWSNGIFKKGAVTW